MDQKVTDSSSTSQCAWNIQITKTVSTKTGAKRPSPKNLVQSKLIPTCTLTKFHACGNSTCQHHTHSNSNSSVTSIWNIITNAATIVSTSSQVKFSAQFSAKIRFWPDYDLNLNITHIIWVIIITFRCHRWWLPKTRSILWSTRWWPIPTWRNWKPCFNERCHELFHSTIRH